MQYLEKMWYFFGFEFLLKLLKFVLTVLLKFKKTIVSHILYFKTHFILNNEPKVVMDITFQLKNTTVKVHTLKAGMSSAYTLSFNGNIQFPV